MRASIIIPVAGDPETCPLTLDCVRTLTQHHRPFLNAADGFELKVIGHTTNIHTAWNHGAQQSRGRTLVFLNNDTVTHGAWLDALLAEIESSRHDLITGVRMRTEQNLPKRITNQTGNQFLEGWCFACRRTLWERLPFDEAFTLYFGDTDFMARADCPLHAVPAIERNLLHLGQQSTKLRPDRLQVWARDRATFIRKWS